MAPISAEAARPAQKPQARRPVSRIVPAIPHRLSRRVPAATPKAAEVSPKDAATQQKQEPEPQVQLQVQQPAAGEKKAEEQPAQTASAPESKLPVDKPEPEPESEPALAAAPPALASSPAKSQDEELQQPTEAPGESTDPSEF